MKNIKTLILLLGSLVALGSCSKSPDTPDVSFAYSTYSYTEGFDNCYIAVYQMESPYEWPVEVSLHGKVTSGTDNLGRELGWKDIIVFDEDYLAEEGYTVSDINAKEFLISGVTVTYTEYNKKIYFESKGNDWLQGSNITITFTITNVKGSNKGSSDTTTVSIVDDEKAPLIKTGYYETTYTPLADALKPEAGKFYLRLYKTDKYTYVSEGWFGLNRPRLVGTFKPEEQTLTFDGTDYDHTVWFDAEEEIGNRVNAFENDSIWTYNKSEDGIKILRMRGSGHNGTGPIVIKTDKIEQDASGYLVECTTDCGFDIMGNYNAETGKANRFVGVWDGMERSDKMVHSSTNYPTETSRSAIGKATPRPFSQWVIGDINE